MRVLLNILLIGLSGGLLRGMSAQLPAAAPGLSAAERLVEQQIAAWNSHDAAAFAACYATDTTRLFRFPNQPLATFSSRAEVQAYYGRLFQRNPAIHCEVRGRVAAGQSVVVHEVITGAANGEAWQTLAYYQLEHDKIVRVYFDRYPR